MFSTCIHCNSDLGRNETFETFPVGSRLAFDGRHGRLWVICRKCDRWNLSPLDERWEAIEDAERRFRDSRLRVSTDNIGLARLREGVDLIRIGDPQRPEMAAWRYGDQFGRRRKRQMLATGVVAGGAVAVVGGIMAAGIGIGAFAGQFPNLYKLIRDGRPGEIIGAIPLGDGQSVQFTRLHARMSVVELPQDGDGFALRLESKSGTHLLRGDDAARVAARLMPTVNRFGGTRVQVQEAVAELEAIGNPDHFLSRLTDRVGARAGAERWKRKPNVFGGDPGEKTIPGALHQMTPRDRLALEMALHEDSERRAMEGELALLEAAWRDAEEIAQIADGMFVAPAIEAQLDALRTRLPDGR